MEIFIIIFDETIIAYALKLPIKKKQINYGSSYVYVYQGSTSKSKF